MAKSLALTNPGRQIRCGCDMGLLFVCEVVRKRMGIAGRETALNVVSISTEVPIDNYYNCTGTYTLRPHSYKSR